VEAGRPGAEEPDDDVIVRASGLFDERFYLDQNTDVKDAGLDPVRHYMISGHIEGRDPSADFRTTYYRVKYLKGNLAVNPLVHYSTIGRQAGNHTAPGPHDDADEVHLGIRASVQPGDDFEEPDPDIAAGSRSTVKALAFYLPQFHAIAENDDWWGRGFTDWRNVARATPRFAGHYQPRIPRDLGFYDLGQPDVMQRQVELARGAGLHGFVFYYYWFDGKRLLERPLEGFLDDPTIEFPFCLAWANENWTRRWDGRDDDILIAQRYDPDHDVGLVDDLQRHFSDQRYIRLQGRPLLLLYRVDCIPDAARRIESWRELWQSRHDEEPLIFVAQAFGATDPRLFGVDGAYELPPHKLVERVSAINSQLTILDPVFRGYVVAYEDIVREALAEPTPAYPFIRTAVPSWDNDGRRQGESLTLHGSTPAIYERWVRTLAEHAARQPVFGEPLVFINAWNEWAEGAYLEPDVHHGAAYLNATARALSNARPTAKRKVLLVGHDAHRHGAQMIVRHIGETLSSQFGCEVAWLLLGGGAMVPEYEQLGRVWMVDDDAAQIAAAVAELRRDGFELAVANTTISGAAVPHLKAEGFRVVSLIHELPGIIGELRADESLASILEGGDTIVVPAENVADAIALGASPDVRRRVVVRPQGLYKELEQPPDARIRLRRRLGIGADSRIVLNVGFGDLRKGIDTFVHVAKLAAARAKDLHFVWVGNLHGEAERWLSADFGSAVRDRIHFVPYEEDVAEFYFGADAFFLSSREDPFPSVVLEALSAGLPVVGLVGASGTEELIAEHGRLVDRDDLVGVVTALDEATREDDERARAARARVVAEQFRYDDYCFDLLRILDPDLEKVSVVVPNYNHARYLNERMRSIFDQTYPIFETLVLDDCSTDDSLARFDEIATASGRRFRLITNEENSGSPFAQWERGCRLARGKYVWVAEADDGSDPRFLEEMVSRLRSDGASFVFSDSVPVDGEGATLASSYKAYYRESVGNLMDSSFVLDGKSFLERCLAERNLVLNASAVVWERETLLDALASSRDALQEYRLAGDWHLYAAAALSAPRVAYLSSPLNVHRRHDSSVTATLNRDKHVEEVERVQSFVAEAVSVNDTTRRRMRAYADRLRDQFGVAGQDTPAAEADPGILLQRTAGDDD
jgi:glycosyltransferase involved in cell wall biosynthesis